MSFHYLEFPGFVTCLMKEKNPFWMQLDHFFFFSPPLLPEKQKKKCEGQTFSTVTDIFKPSVDEIISDDKEKICMCPFSSLKSCNSRSTVEEHSQYIQIKQRIFILL